MIGRNGDCKGALRAIHPDYCIIRQDGYWRSRVMCIDEVE